MRLRADPVSRADRFASTAAASGLTIASALVLLTSSPSRFAAAPTSSPARAPSSDASHPADRITYVRPVATPPVAPVRAADKPRPRSVPAPKAAPVLPQPVAHDSSSRAAPPRPDPATNATRPPAQSDFERRWTSHGISPLLVPASSGEPAYARGGTQTPAFKLVPDTAANRDAQLRAQALEDMAAHAAGSPLPTTPRGTSIDAPIPFGGPSNAQRKRDSAINAQTKAVLVRVRQRLDSIAAARRRHADSTAHPDPRR